jgi:glycosyltransferase involved in cell wall biosynthesis
LIAKSEFLILGEAFYPEEFLINDLAKEWEACGYNVEVLTRTPSYPFGKVYRGYRNSLYQNERWGNILIHRFPVIQGYQKSKFNKVLNYLSFVFFGSLIGIFLAKKYRRIFIYHTGPLSLAIPGILLKKISHSKVTIWSFDLWPATVYAYGFKKTKLLSWFLDHLVHWIYKNCDNIIVSSPGFVETLKKYAPEKEIFVAPNWPQTQTVISKKSCVILPSGYTHFTFAGNVGKVQNLENTIRGFKNASLKNAILNIFGDGSNFEYLKDLIRTENITNVIMHGRVPVSEINDILAQSDVLVIPLSPDPVMELTIPLKFQTYLMAAKPIFAIMSGEVAKYVIKYNLGYVAQPLEIKEIEEGFKSFISKPIDRELIKSNSSELIASDFCKEKIIKKVTEIFLGY